MSRNVASLTLSTVTSYGQKQEAFQKGTLDSLTYYTWKKVRYLCWREHRQQKPRDFGMAIILQLPNET
jgi:hypothetical protein